MQSTILLCVEKGVLVKLNPGYKFEGITATLLSKSSEMISMICAGQEKEKLQKSVTHWTPKNSQDSTDGIVVKGLD